MTISEPTMMKAWFLNERASLISPFCWARVGGPLQGGPGDGRDEQRGEQAEGRVKVDPGGSDGVDGRLVEVGAATGRDGEGVQPFDELRRRGEERARRT